jgi:hypothetical protein
MDHMTHSNHDDRDPAGRATRGGCSDRGDRDEGREQGGNAEEGAGRGRHSRRRHGGHRRHQGRKERVLHTRISEQLSEDIRRLAEDLRVPTSNLVRNVLEEVFTMVETVSEDVGGLFDEVLDEAEGVRDRIRRRARRGQHGRSGASGQRRGNFDENVESELRQDEDRERGPGGAQAPSGDPQAEHVERREVREFPDVIGWQPLVLNRDQKCANCDVDLHRGARAFVGLGESGLTGTTLCQPCTGSR